MIESILILIAATFPFVSRNSGKLHEYQYDLFKTASTNRNVESLFQHHHTKVILHACNSILLFHLMKTFLMRSQKMVKQTTVNLSCFLATLIFTTHLSRCNSFLVTSNPTNQISTSFILFGLILFVNELDENVHGSCERLSFKIKVVVISVCLTVGALLQPTCPILVCTALSAFLVYLAEGRQRSITVLLSGILFLASALLSLLDESLQLGLNTDSLMAVVLALHETGALLLISLSEVVLLQMIGPDASGHSLAHDSLVVFSIGLLVFITVCLFFVIATWVAKPTMSCALRRLQLFSQASLVYLLLCVPFAVAHTHQVLLLDVDAPHSLEGLRATLSEGTYLSGCMLSMLIGAMLSNVLSGGSGESSAVVVTVMQRETSSSGVPRMAEVGGQRSAATALSLRVGPFLLLAMALRSYVWMAERS